MDNNNINNNNNKLYGWYSQQMRDRINENNRHRLPVRIKRNPAHIYQTPEGKEVIVTTVSKANNLTDLRKDGLFVGYNDIYCIGEVTNHVRSLKE